METVAARPHSTHAQASRERRDVVSGEVMAEARLIRFVAGPDGAVVPDLARKLPGRGIWVAADRVSVETAAKKGLFARSAKAKLTAPKRPGRRGGPAAQSAAFVGAGPCEARRRPYLGIREGDGHDFVRQGRLADRGVRRRCRTAGARSAVRPQAASRPRDSRPVQRRGIGFGLGTGECDTHRLPCGASRRALDRRCPSFCGIQSAPS